MIYYNDINMNLKFKTNHEVFSPNDIDKGTLSMLSLVEFGKKDKVLDLGWIWLYWNICKPVCPAAASDYE